MEGWKKGFLRVATVATMLTGSAAGSEALAQDSKNQNNIEQSDQGKVISDTTFVEGDKTFNLKEVRTLDGVKINELSYKGQKLDLSCGDVGVDGDMTLLIKSVEFEDIGKLKKVLTVKGIPPVVFIGHPEKAKDIILRFILVSKDGKESFERIDLDKK